VDHIVEAARPSCSWFDSFEAFGKDPPIASPSVAEKATGPQNQRYSHACGRKIRQSSPILTVHAATNTSAHRASANGRRAPYRDRQAAVVFGRALNGKPPRNKLRNIKPLHGSLIPCPNQSQSGASTSSKLSQSQFCTPKHSHAGTQAPSRTENLAPDDKVITDEEGDASASDNDETTNCDVPSRVNSRLDRWRCRRGLDNDFQTILDCGGQSRQGVRFNLIKPVFPAHAV
jgi:hypothetical protein